MKKLFLVVMAVLALTVCMNVPAAVGQDIGSAGEIVPAADAGVAKPKVDPSSFWVVVTGSGFWGFVLWLGLFGSMGAFVYFAIDCGITIQSKRIMPQSLIDSVTDAMTEGDVLKALHSCESEPGPLANVLTAGFSHVEEGFEVIEQAISTAAELETEKMMQKISWISVCANVAPMLGLLGTVQGMIRAFAVLAGGAPDVAVLALNISQALYTTAWGLSVAIPAVTVFYIFRNTASRIVLKMEAMTMELIKDLRNVEVVQE